MHIFDVVVVVSGKLQNYSSKSSGGHWNQGSSYNRSNDMSNSRGYGSSYGMSMVGVTAPELRSIRKKKNASSIHVGQCQLFALQSSSQSSSASNWSSATSNYTPQQQQWLQWQQQGPVMQANQHQNQQVSHAKRVNFNFFFIYCSFVSASLTLDRQQC